ncbi:MAG: hypothetical protein HOU01_22655, partial [Streptomycetaceae bacterium]|nr:hypothetical protein [Streptomycetaceae bacterium]
KQPLFKVAAAALALVRHGDGIPAPAPTTGASAPAAGITVAATAGGPTAHATQTRHPAWDASGSDR